MEKISPPHICFQQLKTKAPNEFIQKCFGLRPIKVMCYPNKQCGGKKKIWIYFKKKHSLRNSYKGDFNGKWAKDTLLSSLWERLVAFWTPHMTGYLMEPIRGNKDSKRTPHERPKMLKLHKRSFSRETAEQTPICHGNGRDSKCLKHLIF